MSTDSTAPLGLLRSIVLGFWPWFTHVREASDKGLSFKTEASRLHLEGDVGDPGAIRTTDTGGALAWGPITGPMYRPPGGAWAPVALNPNDALSLPPGPTFAGTPVALGPGSGKVTIAT